MSSERTVFIESTLQTQPLSNLNTERLNSTVIDTNFQNWIADLEKRHLADLTFSEVSRALRALSSAYVERRGKLAEGAALAGAGKRAAFALFYGPLHFLLVQHIVGELMGADQEANHVVDLGCGTGAAGAAISTAQVAGVDRSSWAVGEAARTYRVFRLDGKAWQGDAGAFALPKRPVFIVAAFTMNELPEPARDALFTRLITRAQTNGDRVLVIEPIARRITPWWDTWRRRFDAAGGRSDEWRTAVKLPEIVGKLDRAAGLRHDELTGRSLWLSGSPAARPISEVSKAASS